VCGYRIEAVCLPAQRTSQVKYGELFLIHAIAVLRVGLYSAVFCVKHGTYLENLKFLENSFMSSFHSIL